MYKNMQELMLEDTDLRSLDKAAAQNNLIRDKQYSMMQNIMKKTEEFYSFVNASKIAAICARLQGKGIGAYELDQAINKIIDNYDRFPSFKAIYELCASYRESSIETFDREKKQIEEEDKKIEEIEKNFIAVFGSEKLPLYVKWWLKEHYDLDKDLLESMSLSVDLFKKPALFDWFDSGYTKHISQVSVIFEKKKKKLEKLNATPHRKAYLRL